jgi:adenosylcobinamide-GDP ribazoletransferase
MTALLLALQFLTSLPLKIKDFSREKLAFSLVYFPTVGLLLGLLLLGVNFLLSLLGLPDMLINIFLVISLIILTAGMHLDGLSDTADAFLSGKGEKEMLEIMRDPHIGVMGVITLASCLLLKFGLLSSIASGLKPAALLLMCIISRWSVVAMMYLFSYARQEGKAKLFMQGMNFKIFLLALIMAAAFVFAATGFKGLLIMLIIAGLTYLIGMASLRKIGGITGDVLGAAIEINELAILFIFCLV